MSKTASLLLIICFVLSGAALALKAVPFEEGIKPIKLKTQSSKVKTSAQSSKKAATKLLFPKEVKEEMPDIPPLVKNTAKIDANSPRFINLLVNIVSVLLLLIIIMAIVFILLTKKKE